MKSIISNIQREHYTPKHTQNGKQRHKPTSNRSQSDSRKRRECLYYTGSYFSAIYLHYFHHFYSQAYRLEPSTGIGTGKQPEKSCKVRENRGKFQESFENGTLLFRDSYNRNTAIPNPV